MTKKFRINPSTLTQQQPMRPWMRHVLHSAVPMCLLAGAALCPSAYAQGVTATLGGIVTDTSGAIVPKAQITLKNEATGDTRTLVSNGAGVFNFAALPSGDYDVTIVSKSFQTFQRNGIHLDPGDERNIRDINLTAGATETIDVSSAADTVNVDSGEQSSLISAEEIKHLSVEGRDVTELLKILPGFAISRGGAGSIDNSSYDPSQVQPSGALGQYAANGTPVNGQALLTDGVDITDPGNFGQAIQNVNYEQVAEVKIQTSSFTADTAHGPIVINAIGKSGGQKFHGSLYTFARVSQLNSTDWIAKYSGQSKPPDRYIYPGFTLGGPVIIPGTNFNKNRKLTFFMGGEEYAQRNAYAYGSASTATLTALVPTAAMRTGDFSLPQIQSYLGNSYILNSMGTACSVVGGGNVPDANICSVPQTAPNGTALANGNIGPYLDPLGKIVLNELPLPNTPSNGTYNYITTNLIRNDLWQARGRVDYNPGEKDKFFALYSVEKGYQGVPQNEYYSARGNLGGVDIPGGGLLSGIQSHIASLNYSRILSNSLTNEFYVAGAFFSQNFTAKNQAAIANNPYQGLFKNGSVVQPTLEDYGNDGLPLLRTPDTSFGGIFAKKQIRIAGDNVTKVLGKHTIRGGVFYQFSSNPQVAPFINTNGTVDQYYIGETFNDPVQGTVHSTGAVGSGNGGNYLADFGEGQIFQYSQTNIAPEPNLFFYNFSGYAQDHWLATRRLTVDFGVRIEHITPWEDSHNIGLAVFTPAAYAAGTNPTLPGVSWHALNSAIPNAGRATKAAFISPRGGFAYDLSGKGATILRGGLGFYRAHDSYNDATNQADTTIGLRTVQITGPLLLSSVSSQQSVVTQGNGFTPDSAVYAFDPTDDETPRVFTYNAAIDQRLPGKMLVEIAYVGNKSDKLLNDGSTQNTKLDDLNTLPIGALFGAQPATRPDHPELIPGTLYPIIPVPGSTGNNSVGGLSTAGVDSYRRFPLYSHVYVPEHNAYANYNALQVGITKQAGKAIFNVNYTWEKALGVLGIGGSSTYSAPGDPFNYRNDYTNEPFDRRNIFNAAYSYNFGDVVHNMRFVGGFVNGWELSGISNYQSGPNLPTINATSNFGIGGSINIPVGATAGVGANQSVCAVASTTAAQQCNVGVSNTNILGTPDVNLQPLLVGNPQQINKGAHQYVNAAAFALPSVGTNGAYKFGFLPGPGFFNTDLTAAKRIKINDASSLQLRLAAFNFINHANQTFTAVNPANYTLTYGATSTANNLNTALNSASGASSQGFGFAPLKEGRRILEVALRYDF